MSDRSINVAAMKGLNRSNSCYLCNCDTTQTLLLLICYETRMLGSYIGSIVRDTFSFFSLILMEMRDLILFEVAESDLKLNFIFWTYQHVLHM